MSETSQPGNNGPGQIISSVRSIRLAIFIITTSLIATCAIFNVIGFGENSHPERIQNDIEPNISVENNTNSSNDTFLNTTFMVSETTQLTASTQELDIPPIYLFLCGLSLSAISAFLHAGFILKLIMMMITVAVQTLILYTSEKFEDYEEYILQDYSHTNM
jgi:adenylate cyclase 2